MSYEYSSESRSLDFPNPFKVENYFRFAAGAFLIIGGLMLLLLSRFNLASALSLWSAAPLVLGAGLLLHGIGYIAKAMAQLRFFFGRGEPRSLAPDLTVETGGINSDSSVLKETMRQNALTFDEPVGALNGLLYTLLPPLIYAPRPVQFIAQRQFQTALAIVATLLSLLVAWIGFGNRPHSGWIGLFYFGFAAFLLLRPLDNYAPANLHVHGLLALILVAIFAPVLIPFVAGNLPDLNWLSLTSQTFFLLVAALGAVVLFFVALTKQLIAPPTTTMGCETNTVSFNAHPKQLLDELDRELQRNWLEKIPNRRYIKTLPVLDGGSGVFAGEALEETQPMSPATQPRIDLAFCMREPRYQWLTLLSLLGLVLMLIAVVALVYFGNRFNAETMERSIFVYAIFGVSMLLVANFCFRAGHLLWGRFDFLSELVWVEMKGNHNAAKFDYGNQFTDHVKTQKEIVNIETMTLRVWAAQIETISFGKGAKRWLVGMRGMPDKARYLCDHLAQFAREQSMIISPSSSADMQKVAALSAINRFSADASGDVPPGLEDLMAKIRAPDSLVPRTVPGDAALQCAQCQISNGAGARFCTQCGSALHLA